MTIQVIQYGIISAEPEENIFFSPLDAPKALDDYEYDIIDLSDPEMWGYSDDTVGVVDSNKDLETIYKMVENSKKATIVYILPQNCKYSSGRYTTHVNALKDIIPNIMSRSLKTAVYPNFHNQKIEYEATKTSIGSLTYSADFYFNTTNFVITKSEKSEKPTTIQLEENIYITTLNATLDSGALLNFLKCLFFPKDKEETPAWMQEVNYGDDEEQYKIVQDAENKIVAAKEEIERANAKLAENNRIKSIVYTNGEELVEVVIDILEALLNCELSDFEDKKREDFLIIKPHCTFIGEIKGVTSNIKYEHISQLELHYRGYLDDLDEQNKTETVKQILIMNPFRSKALKEREPVHTSQIELAKRNECLIIETETLLRIYEKYCAGEISSDECIDIFLTKNGLLKLEDFN